MNRRESMTNKDRNNTNDPQKKYRLGTVSKFILLEGLNQFYGTNLANLALNSDVDQDTFGKETKHNNDYSPFPADDHKATRNRHHIKTHRHEALLTKTIHKRSNALERSVKIILLEGLNLIDNKCMSYLSSLILIHTVCIHIYISQ